MSPYKITDHTSVLTPSEGSKTKFHCPVCNGHNLDIKQSTGAYNCFNGCDCEDIRAAIDNIEGKPEWKPERDDWKKPIRSKSEKDYFYLDRNGNPLIKVVRIDPGDESKKVLSQYHWTGDKWESGNPKEIRHLIPIYRYEEVRQAIELDIIRLDFRSIEQGETFSFIVHNVSVFAQNLLVISDLGGGK